MFRVRWEESALNELADLWLQADSTLRPLITAASHEVDLRLQADPFADSHPLQHGHLVRFVLPLGITYRVEADGVTVSVLHVWLVVSHNGSMTP
jgi:hypothetical protein